MIEFHQTKTGQTYYEKHVPALIKELGELKDELKELNKPKETKVVSLEYEYRLAETIQGYAKKGWTLKHYLPEHHSTMNEEYVHTVLVFER